MKQIVTILVAAFAIMSCGNAPQKAETADEMKANNVSTDELEAAAAKENVPETLRGKLGDTALVVREYERLISGSFFDPADKLTALCEILDGREFFICDFLDTNLQTTTWYSNYEEVFE